MLAFRFTLILAVWLLAGQVDYRTTLMWSAVEATRQTLVEQALARPPQGSLEQAAARAGGATTWAGLQERFLKLDPARQEPLAEAAMRAMVDSLQDPYSTVLTSEEMALEHSAHQDGSFTGIGVELAWRGGLVVVACLDGSPAAAAGLQPGDFLVAVDGVPLKGLTFYQAGNRLLGPVGSRAVLDVVRRGRPLQLTATRQALRLPPVAYKRLSDPRLGYVRVGFFGPDTADRVRACLTALQGCQGLVLDLRNNPGGDFPQGVETAGFFAGGPLLTVETRKGKQQVSGSGVIWKGPVAVLINGGSASASEIVAQALQGRPGRALVGSQSFGKGRIQTLFPLPGGAGMNLTTGRYLSLVGVDLHGRGLTPDVASADALAAAQQWLLKSL